MHVDEAEIDRISDCAIGRTFGLMNKLGCGFLEKIYEDALVNELQKVGLSVAQQYGIKVRCDDIIVGEYAADLPLEATVVVELKAVKALDGVHATQCINNSKRAVCSSVHCSILASRAWKSIVWPTAFEMWHCPSACICVHLRASVVPNSCFGWAAVSCVVW